jgi:hypothetical protein
MANESLQASFGLDIAPLQQSLSRATNAVQKFAIGFAGYISIKATMDQFKQSLDLGGHLLDLSNKTGIGAGALYDLGEAGRDAGLSLDDITSSVTKMQKGLGTSASSSVLKALGLDPQALASAKPELAFQKIGQAISNLKNPTEQTQAALALFGKSGARMLQLFNDPAFRNGIGSSQASQILEKNAAVFDRLGDSLGRIRPRITEFFNGFNSANAANLERMADAIDRLDLSQKGVDAGSIVATFTEAFVQGQIGNLIWLDLKVAFARIINFLAGGIFALFGSIPAQMAIATTVFTSGLAAINETSFWTGLYDTLMSFVNSFNAGLLGGIASLVNEMRNIPLVGGSIGKGADAIDQKASEFRNLAMQQGSSGFDKIKRVNDNFRDQVAEAVGFATSDFVKKFQNFDLFGSGSEQELQALTDSIFQSLQKSNQDARDRAEAGKRNKDGLFNASDIGMGAKQSIFADSLAKVGGGGISIGGGGNPILEENKRQTGLLQKIHQSLSKGSQGQAEFAPA